MIKSFGAQNFYSFKEGLEVDFTLSMKTPGEMRDHGSISHVMGIKGANGSGKTNVLKALNFILDFSQDSWRLEVDKPIPYRSYFHCHESSKFYIHTECNDHDYEYSFEIKSFQVIAEKLEITPNGERSRVLFSRKENELIDLDNELIEFKTINLKANSSLISLLYKYNFTADMTELKAFNRSLMSQIANVGESGYFNIDQTSESVSFAYEKSEEAFSLLKKILMKADSDIQDITIVSYKNPDGTDVFHPLFTHETAEGIRRLDLAAESSGTQALYKRMYIYWWVLNTGGVLIFDEFDIHIHSLLLPVIIDLFTDKATNPKNAQLIFTSHNTEILEALGRYRTVLVNKKDNESFCYRLDELKGSALRNGRPISPLYLKGKLGGVPTGV